MAVDPKANIELYECDVLVAGSGCSGMSAAITAKHSGLDVLILSLIHISEPTRPY